MKIIFGRIGFSRGHIFLMGRGCNNSGMIGTTVHVILVNIHINIFLIPLYKIYIHRLILGIVTSNRQPTFNCMTFVWKS